MSSRILLPTLLAMVATSNAFAEPCAGESSETEVTGVSQCLLMRKYGTDQPNTLVVWLHGDVGSGGPANYHYSLAQKTSEDFAAEGVMSVALVRPGYPDGGGKSSTVSFFHSGRWDHYTQENIAEVGAAIEALRRKYAPSFVILVGHSGGAATAAVLLGMKPQVADAAVLVSCPCELVSWRSGGRPWTRSENPYQWAEKVSTSTKVIALTGTKDDNTPPNLATVYVERLKSRGIDASFQPVAESTHNNAIRSAEVTGAIAKLLRR